MQEGFIRLKVLRVSPEQPLLLGHLERDCQLGNHPLDHVVFDSKKVLTLTVISLCPQMVSLERVDELNADPHSVSGPTYATLDYVANAKILGDLANFHRLVFVNKGRVARDDEKP
jgi:hypothetical protein